MLDSHQLEYGFVFTMAVNSLVCHVMLLLIHTWIIGVNGGDCNAVYQGIPTFKNCTYRCHCKNDEQCNETTGECGNGCTLGWMGPGCQYRNIARENFKTENFGPAVDDSDSGAQAVDGDVNSCSKTNVTKGKGRQYWRIQWNNLYRIVGLIVKIHLDDVGNFNKFRVETGSGPNNANFTSVCYTHGDTPGTTEMEIMCTQPVSTRHLRIIHDKGNVEMRVCEVEIYGGRAVTFNKYTNQSSTKSNRSSWLSVDGQAHVSGVEAKDTCSSTEKQMNPYWLVDFMTFYVVQSVYFYGGMEGLHPEYKQFKIFLLNASSDGIEIYNDTGTGYSMYQPMVIEQSKQTTARYLNISRPVTTDVLAICEVIAFAVCHTLLIQTECPIHKCGWDCNTECYCAAETTGQYQIDGDCPYGCSGRWTGTEKKCNVECNATTWGQQCQNTCGNCDGTEPCNIVTGHCEHGCNGTLYPPHCTEECKDTAYGINCSQTCGHCKNNMRCNILTGNCTNGCMSGWKPPLCQEACALGTFGVSCSKTCGHCHGNTTCNVSTGICKDGCDPGYYTQFCNTSLYMFAYLFE